MPSQFSYLVKTSHLPVMSVKNQSELWFHGAYEPSVTKTLTINALKAANNTFVSLNHYGFFTEQDSFVWIGKVNTIVSGGLVNGMASDYASYAYGTSGIILETYLWSQAEGAEKSLWGLDYYPCVVLEFIQSLQR